MNVDFIEIGTSDFNTLIETANDTTVGFSIEALDFYLDRLPNKKNVQKINMAISPTTERRMDEIYYIPLSVIEEKRLKKWARGCSSIGKLHPDAIPQRLDKYYVKKPIEVVPLTDFIIEQGIIGIGTLKIDVEGLDCNILDYYYDFISERSKDYWPKTIIFEHKHSDNTLYSDVVSKYKSLGYSAKKVNVDTHLTQM